MRSGCQLRWPPSNQAVKTHRADILCTTHRLANPFQAAEFHCPQYTVASFNPLVASEAAEQSARDEVRERASVRILILQLPRQQLEVRFEIV